MKKIFLILVAATSALAQTVPPRGSNAVPPASSRSSSNYNEVVLSSCVKFGDMDVRAATLENTVNQCNAQTGQNFLKLVYPYMVYEEVLILIPGTAAGQPVFEKQIERVREATVTINSSYVPTATFKEATDLPLMQKSVVAAWEAFNSQHSMEICK